MGERERYRAAAYLRLSREDEDMDEGVKDESSSIATQRELICSFIGEQEDMELADIYVDDGYSGASFDRPDFKRMMADIEAGRVNCVIVKDLSRFGRDYIEAGRLIQRTFPAFSVRFISLADHYDSLTADRNTTSLVIPVKNFINDSYCRDISCKVKSHQHIKRRQGKFIGAFAPYGYRKDEEDRNRLVFDEYAAGVVRAVFSWRLEGMSCLAIARRLNALGILSPFEYKKSHGENYATGFQTRAVSEWSQAAVKRILTNEVYTGTLVQGKREKLSYKGKQTAKRPSAEWVRAEGTHAGIVSREDYERVQRLLQVPVRAGRGMEGAHRFSGLLFCGDCREPLLRRRRSRRGEERISYICPRRNRGEGCTRHRIEEGELCGIVAAVMRRQAELSLDRDRLRAHIGELWEKREMRAKPERELELELERLKREEEKYEGLRAGLYEDFKAQVIDEADFKAFGAVYEEQQRAAAEARRRQERLYMEMAGGGEERDAWLGRMEEALGLREADRSMLLAFVDRIEVYENKALLVRLTFCRTFGEAPV